MKLTLEFKKKTPSRWVSGSTLALHSNQIALNCWISINIFFATRIVFCLLGAQYQLLWRLVAFSTQFSFRSNPVFVANTNKAFARLPACTWCYSQIYQQNDTHTHVAYETNGDEELTLFLQSSSLSSSALATAGLFFCCCCCYQFCCCCCYKFSLALLFAGHRLVDSIQCDASDFCRLRFNYFAHIFGEHPSVSIAT